MQPEYFGTPAQQALMHKSAALWRLARHNPALSYNGRMISVSAVAAPDPIGMAVDLVQVQGATSLHFIPVAEADTLRTRLAAEGFATSFFHQYEADDAAQNAAGEFLANHPLPEGLCTVWIGPQSDPELVSAVADLSLASGVTPSGGWAMRGYGPASACLALCDRAGRVVASGMSFLGYPPGSPHADQAFWGMLATRPDWRGRRLAAHVGCRLIRRMWTEHGARGFLTGINPDNSVSAAVCSTMGFACKGSALISCSDPAEFPSGRMTK